MALRISNKLKDIRIKLLAAKYVLQAGKPVPVRKLTLRRMTVEEARYAGLAKGLATLPVPDSLRLGRKVLPVPKDMEELCGNITYGQRLFFTQKEGFDTGIILRLVAGYYYTLYTGCTWNEKRALSFGKIVLNSLAKDLYPVATHLTELMEQLVARESKLLQRQPTKQEKAAGIERLAKFADLTSLLFLQESFRCTAEQVMLAPYDDCLVRFMLAKEQNQFNERLTEIYRKENQPKKGKK